MKDRPAGFQSYEKNIRCCQISRRHLLLWNNDVYVSVNDKINYSVIVDTPTRMRQTDIQGRDKILFFWFP